MKAVADAVLVNGPVVENTPTRPAANGSGTPYESEDVSPAPTGTTASGVTAPSTGSETASNSIKNPDTVVAMQYASITLPALALKIWLRSKTVDLTEATGVAGAGENVPAV